MINCLMGLLIIIFIFILNNSKNVEAYTEPSITTQISTIDGRVSSLEEKVDVLNNKYNILLWGGKDSDKTPIKGTYKPLTSDQITSLSDKANQLPSFSKMLKNSNIFSITS